MKQVSGQMSLFDPGMPYGKMSRVHSVPTKEKTSASSSKSSARSKTAMPLFLDLRVGSGNLAGVSWEMGIPWLGACSTRVFGEYPNVAEESGLWQILEANVPQKYYLSAKACAGVLRRAERRGKELPTILKTALEQQIERWEKYGTPLPVFDVSVAGVEGIDIYNATTTGKVSKTLTSAATDIDHTPVVCYDARGNGDGKTVPTITGDHNNRITDYTATCIGRAAFNSGGNTQFSPSVSETGIAQTVTAKGPGAVCYALQWNVVDRNADCNGRGWKKDESYTLNTVDRHSVVYAIGNGQTNQMKLSDEARTLNCMHDQQAVLVALEQTEPVYIVRRLTPLECCRLQGMPDFWCDGIPHSDAQEYRMWGNGMALPNALYIMEGIADAFAKEGMG